jgi:hypothetical protein
VLEINNVLRVEIACLNDPKQYYYKQIFLLPKGVVLVMDERNLNDPMAGKICGEKNHN